jgi:hypothetical protein
VKRTRTVRRVMSSVLAILGLAAIPTSLFAQPSDSNAAAVGIPPGAVALRPAPAEQILRLAVSGERVQLGGPSPQRAASRDSLRNGAVIGAVIGAAALGAFAATLCHVHRESRGAADGWPAVTAGGWDAMRKRYLDSIEVGNTNRGRVGLTW